LKDGRLLDAGVSSRRDLDRFFGAELSRPGVEVASSSPDIENKFGKLVNVCGTLVNVS